MIQIMLSNNQPQTNSPRRYDTGSTTVFFPLPKTMLDYIFSDHLRDKILGKSFGNLSGTASWDKNTGIVTIRNSVSFRVIAATQNNIHKIYEYVKNNGTAEEIIRQLSVIGPAKVNEKIELLADSIGSNLTLIDPYEFSVGSLNGISEFRRRHLSEDPQWILIEDSGSIGSKGRVKSVALPTSENNLPGSHPELAPVHQVKSASKAADDNHPFAKQKQKIEAMFNDVAIGKTEMIPTPSPADIPKITDRIVAGTKGDIHVLSTSDQPTQAVMSITNDSIRNTATKIVDGTVYRSTLDGYSTNAFPAHPSSFYYPHPANISLFGFSPYTLFDNPRDLAIIIGLALISDSSSKKSYHYSYIKTTTVIDNQNIDDELYGE